MTVPKRRASAPQQCGVCSKSFKTLEAITSHCVAMGHQADQCCQRCRRLFGSPEALTQHNDSRHRRLPALTSTNLRPAARRDSGIASSSYSYAFICRGNPYTHLSTVDQSTIYDMLVSACHPQDRPRKERYHLPAEPQEESYAAKESEWTQSHYLLTPKPEHSLPKRRAVALDCEMARVQGGQSAVVSICVVEFLTGKVLVNSLVMPRLPITDWRCGVSGVTPAIMSLAVAHNQALDGWEGARVELYRHIDEDTVLVGQSLKFDLQALRVIHGKIVDTAILTAEAVFGRDKTLRRVDLKIWATKECKSFWRKNDAKKRTRKKPKPKAVRRPPRQGGGGGDRDSDLSADEVLQWEDVIDYDMWPKSPPDWD
ncbi:hypothetical protein DL766_002782 [Monosporascus sp. MC13-8B]|uniref:C2H2-type domain-containing protein n=1 Tax=Monosporascus cannonballus TaxID=155416 RepID=A0ABY0HIS1_9PEZI|nr:hypothetical protein DL762_000530 [Monosporascus cannonballus]RYO96041.1 hypothetical protein DL763_003433 [Monosporascus cannonballus]RYP34884.1 hypothetical protein DL766_002782 [Monosporascus sp. MC13-8B]